MLSLQQLITAPTEDEALASILSILSQLGLQTTSWQTGSAQLLFVRLLARVWTAVSRTIVTIAVGGFATLSANTDGGSPFLRLIAKYFYSLDYIPASSTIGKILLTSSAGAPVHTFAAGDIIIATAATGTPGAVTYTNTEGGTIGPSSTLSIEFKADVAGAASNIAPATTLYMWTPLVGITVTNPALAPASTTWITTAGLDDESDARLLQRCYARWTWLTYGNMDGAYVGWALAALPSLTRVSVASAPGNGTVTLYGATDVGPLTGGECTTITDYINGVPDGIGRRPINDIVSTLPATVVTTPALTFTIYATSQYVDTVGGLAKTDVLVYIGAQPLGGLVLQGTQGRVLYDGMLDAAKYMPSNINNARQLRPGVRSVSLSPAGDVLLSPGQIYEPTITVNVLPVAPGVS